MSDADVINKFCIVAARDGNCVQDVLTALKQYNIESSFEEVRQLIELHYIVLNNPGMKEIQ